jgi:cell division protein FtsA
MKSICALDIGTFNTRAIIASNEDGNIKIKAFFKEPSLGLRKGIIYNVAETSKVLSKIFSEAKKIDYQSISNIYVNVGTIESRMHLSHGSTFISREDGEINSEDLNKVLNLAITSLNLEKNRQILHTIPKDFGVDDVFGILEPLGINGSKLDGYYLIIDVFEPHLKNIYKAINLAKGKVKGPIFNPISSSYAILSNIQKELGAILIDIGFSTTSVAIYEEDKLIYAKILPFGSSNISSDIAIGLKIPYELAEEIKIKYGCAISKSISSKDYIGPEELDNKINNKISKKFLSEIIEARLSEMFEFINNEIKSLDKNLELSGGAIICGGGAKIKGIDDFARKELKLPIQIGLPLSEDFILDNEEFYNYFNDPENANVLGLALFAKKHEGWSKSPKSFLDKIKIFLSYFKP